MACCGSHRDLLVLGRLLLLLVLRRRLRIPAGVLRLHLPLLGPGLGRRGSRLGPVVPWLLGQQLQMQSARHQTRLHALCDL